MVVTDPSVGVVAASEAGALTPEALLHAPSLLKPTHTCSHCNKKYRWPVSLRKHIQRDHLGLTYDCTMCNKKYAYETSLRLHQKGCGGTRTMYYCKLCDVKHACPVVTHEKQKTHKKKLLMLSVETSAKTSAQTSARDATRILLDQGRAKPDETKPDETNACESESDWSGDEEFEEERRRMRADERAGTGCVSDLGNTAFWLKQ